MSWSYALYAARPLAEEQETSPCEVRSYGEERRLLCGWREGSSVRRAGDENFGRAGEAGITSIRPLMGFNLGTRSNSLARQDKESFRMSQLRDAQRFIAPCHLLRKGSLRALWCRVRTLPGYSPWPSTLFTAYASTNSSGLSPSSRRDCVQSSRHVPLSSRCTDRTALSISDTTRPPYLAAFYVFSGRVVNPVTREPLHLDDGDPYRTHMRPRFTLRRSRGRVCRARHAPDITYAGGAMPQAERTGYRCPYGALWSWRRSGRNT
jgi:hypothetical protein